MISIRLKEQYTPWLLLKHPVTLSNPQFSLWFECDVNSLFNTSESLGKMLIFGCAIQPYRKTRTLIFCKTLDYVQLQGFAE